MIVVPDLQVGWATEIEQCFSQELQLLQRQGLNASGGGLAEGAAAAVELAKRDSSSLSGPSTGLALLPALTWWGCRRTP